MTNYYLITAILALLSFVIVIFSFEGKKVNYYILLLLLLMTLANGGYLSIAISKNVEEAILANKICYLAGCFVPPITFLLICAICNYKVATWLRNLLCFYSLTVYVMVLTIGINDFYYKQVYLDKYEDATVLGHVYGIGHSFFYVQLYGYIVVQIVLLLYSIMRKKTVSRKSLCALIVLGIINIVVFILGRFINSAIEVMPLAYVIDGWILLYMYRRGTMYSIEDNINASLRRQETCGYIMFDNHLNYLGCNSKATNMFPTLSECVVDRKIKIVNELEQILERLEKYTINDNDYFTYESEDGHYECHIEPLWYRKKVCGYIIELWEDTDKWRYINLLSAHNSELERFQAELEKKVNEQTEEIRAQEKKMKSLFMQTITALSEAIDAKDRYTSGHSKRVAEYSRMIAVRMGKSKEEQDEIYRAGLLHDVGKIRIPAELINKPGKLTDEEYNLIKIHPVTGYHILRGISDDNDIAVAAKYHHERYDGKGYPNGLLGDTIPEIARILGVADSYDAMASNRSYRSVLPQEVVRSEIEKGKGTQFDPHIADIMLQIIEEDKAYSLKQTDSMQRRILTVDDESMNNKIITHIMSDEPMYEVVSAGSGKEALNILEQQSFDLILLDVKMPEMDGLEVLKLIREKYQVPIVLMTSDKSLDLSIEFAQYGCDDYITKPFLPMLVKEIVHNMTERTNIES